MSKSDRTVRAGKRFEKRVAEYMGAHRIQKLNYGDSLPDLIYDDYVVECKTRERIAVIRWLEQAETYNGRQAIVVMGEKGKRIENAVVMQRLKDWFSDNS